MMRRGLFNFHTHMKILQVFDEHLDFFEVVHRSCRFRKNAAEGEGMDTS
jgi:hypothetical protein